MRLLQRLQLEGHGHHSNKEYWHKALLSRREKFLFLPRVQMLFFYI